MKIYLASKSKRRQELLSQMNIDFDLLLLDTPEIQKPGESAEAYSIRVTAEKLTAAWQLICEENKPKMPVLCADTEVIMDNQILGKPANDQEAFNMLKSYSDRTHLVITTIGLKYENYQKQLTQKTFVTFSSMTDDDIQHYISLGDYQDKSGGYGIQSSIGQFIRHIDGCFYSVMGLPLNMVRELLVDFKKQLLI